MDAAAGVVETRFDDLQAKLLTGNDLVSLNPVIGARKKSPIEQLR